MNKVILMGRLTRKPDALNERYSGVEARLMKKRKTAL